MKERLIRILRWSEKYTKTDMVYLASGSFWLNLNTVLSSLFSFLLSIAFARYVSKEVYGSYQFLISFASIAGTLTLTGMNAAVIQAVARGYDGVFKRSVKVQLNYAGIPILFSLAASGYYFLQHNTALSLSLIFIALFVPLINALNTWTAYFNGKRDFRSYFSLNLLLNLLYYPAMLACIFLLPQTTTLVFINFFSLSIGNLAVYFFTSGHYPTDGLEEKEALSYGKKLSLSSILPLIALQIDNILVFHFLGASDLAVYAFASNIPDKFMSLIRPISTLALPKMAARNHDEFRSELGSKIKKLFALSILMSLVYIVIAPFVYRLFFPSYLESVSYSQIYVLAAAISTTTTLAVSFMFASRSNKIYTYNIVNPIFNIGIIILGAWLFGIWGAILGRIIGNSFSLLLSYSFEKIS